MGNSRYCLRRLAPTDARSLRDFYNGLDAEAKRLFRPLGPMTSLDRCREICRENLPGADSKLDIAAVAKRRVVGWAFLWDEEGMPNQAVLGIAVCSGWRERGIGGELMRSLMEAAPGRGLRTIRLIVVVDNERAIRLYQRNGFRITGSMRKADGLDYYSMVKEV